MIILRRDFLFRRGSAVKACATRSIFYGEQNSDFKNRKPEEFVDQSLMDELDKEGFFKKVAQMILAL